LSAGYLASRATLLYDLCGIHNTSVSPWDGASSKLNASAIVVLVPVVTRVFGADSARPLLNSQSKSLVRLINLSLEMECFVKRSAGLASPATFLRSRRRDLTACCTHKVWVSRCLSFPSPCREQIPTAADESVHTLSGTEIPRSLSRLW